MDAVTAPISATGKKEAKHKLTDCKLHFLSISIQFPKETIVTTTLLMKIILHMHYVLPSNFSCLILISEL